MAESLYIHQGSRSEQYEALLPQINGLLEGETNQIANLANVAAALHMQFRWLWIGFYLVDSNQPDQLVLGPFQGPIACTRIAYGRGVCGSAWKENRNGVLTKGGYPSRPARKRTHHSLNQHITGLLMPRLLTRMPLPHYFDNCKYNNDNGRQ